MRCLVFFLLFFPLLVGISQAASITNPLLKVLIRKGILTEEEALEIQKEAAQEAQKQEETTKEAKEPKASPKALQGIKLGTLTYLDYSIGEEKGVDTSAFAITRGYFNFKKEITPWMGFRLTPDVHRDSTGDIKVRLKYAYAWFKLPSLGFLTDIKSEVGQGHFPWLDFQEHVNPYRCQGTMPRERAGTFNSADLGLGVMGYFGGKLPEDYVKELARHYPIFDHYTGKFGSWHLGLYNGGGYHAAEKNNNKPIEGRLTIRPFGAIDSYLRGLQLSYFFIRGKGNVAQNAPDYKVDLFMLSFQHPWFVVTAEYSTSKGNNSGSWVDPDTGRVLKTRLWSVFGDVTLPILQEKLHVFARYDWFDPDTDNICTNGAGDDEYQLYLAGLAYQIHKKNLLLLDAEWVDYGENIAAGSWSKPYSGPSALGIGTGREDNFRVQAVLQVAF